MPRAVRPHHRRPTPTACAPRLQPELCAKASGPHLQLVLPPTAGAPHHAEGTSLRRLCLATRGWALARGQWENSLQQRRPAQPKINRINKYINKINFF